QDQIAPVSLMEIIVRRRGQEMPDVGEWIGGHACVPEGLNCWSTYRLIESLPCVRSEGAPPRGRCAYQQPAKTFQVHCASIHLSDPVNFTDTPVNVIRKGSPSTIPG